MSKIDATDIVYYIFMFMCFLVLITLFWVPAWNVNRENYINQLEKQKNEYCEVIADLSKYAPDSVKAKHQHIIEFAKLQVED